MNLIKQITRGTLALMLLVTLAFGCPKGYYKNSQGRCVPRPVVTTKNNVPAGATARCRDGSYSFSQNRRGTCSHHGGVAEWLN